MGEKKNITVGTIIHGEYTQPKLIYKRGAISKFAKMKKANTAVSGRLYVNNTMSNFSNQRILDEAIFPVYFLINSRFPCVHLECRFLNAT